MNRDNAIIANISNVIITDQQLISLTESATPKRFTPFGAKSLLVVSRKRRKVSSTDKTTSTSYFINNLRTR